MTAPTFGRTTMFVRVKVVAPPFSGTRRIQRTIEEQPVVRTSPLIQSLIAMKLLRNPVMKLLR